MHTKLDFLRRPRWPILLVLVITIVIIIISSFCSTSTDTEPINYGKHVDENGTTTINLRRGESYIDGEIIPCEKTKGIQPLKEI